jgi:hypothetical protein
LEDSQTWLCIQHTRNIVSLSRKTSYGWHGASPTTFTEVESSPGIDGAKW